MGDANREDNPETSGETSAEMSAEAGQRCDFCGEVVPSVRRIALDRDYDRLRTRHAVQYACSTCSERKERERLGLHR